MEYKERSYRSRFSGDERRWFCVKYLESDLWIGVDRGSYSASMEAETYAMLVDLRRQMEENTTMREELAKEQVLMDSLMDNVNDYIYFKDLDGKFIRVSKSYLSLVKANSYEDVVGKSDFDFCSNQDDAQRFYNDEQHISLNQVKLPYKEQFTIFKMQNSGKVETTILELPSIYLKYSSKNFVNSSSLIELILLFFSSSLYSSL